MGTSRRLVLEGISGKFKTLENIKELRLKKKLSQADLAHFANVSAATVWRVEHGHQISELSRARLLDVLEHVNPVCEVSEVTTK